ncbi:hypothetical protein LTR50_003402 [Elasticomyces elasticus]|nr:hypothetical protein LTR50_003402 [Elasticomyces elasticus]
MDAITDEDSEEIILSSATNNHLNGQLVTPASTPVTEHGFSSGQVPDGKTNAQLDNESTPKEGTLTRRHLPRSGVKHHVADANTHSDFLERSPQYDTELDAAKPEAINSVVNTPSNDDRRKRSIGRVSSPPSGGGEPKGAMKLSPKKIRELTASSGSLPIRAVSPILEEMSLLAATPLVHQNGHLETHPNGAVQDRMSSTMSDNVLDAGLKPHTEVLAPLVQDLPSILTTPGSVTIARPSYLCRSATSPVTRRKTSSNKASVAATDQSRSFGPTLAPLKPDNANEGTANGVPKPSPLQDPVSSPMSGRMPMPPLSIPTYLQLALSSDRPSPLYIHPSPMSDFPYEPSKIKFERLLNFFLLPLELEQVLWFGALACLDAWLYTFTILPLRFLKAVLVIMQWAGQNVAREARDIGSFVYQGLGRVWQRKRQNSDTASRRPSFATGEQLGRQISANASLTPVLSLQNGLSPEGFALQGRPRARMADYRHRRTKPRPSSLLPNHKADLLQGLLIITSCMILMRFDASRMYHGIRGQAAIKLYVIYNVLEVCDRLFSALGQDLLECLFSKETLERKPDGRSKIIRPLWLFLLALIYNVIHATALFYQVITLNVAVNSYSNALLTLLMSNQFVEIKGSVFKKFEKENLFQMTCADVVERFQLWLMLIIIAMRNIVEVGGLSISLSSLTAPGSPTESLGGNATRTLLRSMSIIPKSFTMFPKWTGQVLGPFLIVLGSEMLVDWLKHAYISKFNNIKPNLYGRFLDVLTKDYYSHAFADQNLTKRLGLPVLPLSCLFIRASVQTYHMFLATYMPMPLPSSSKSLAVDSTSAETSSAITAALAHIDHVFRRALGRSSFGAGGDPSPPFSTWSFDDFIAMATMLLFFLALYLILLAMKLVLGMCLLSYARSRYTRMKEREKEAVETQGRRVGGWGVVEVDEDKRRWIYKGDEEGLHGVRERETRTKERREKGEVKLDGVGRYMMAAKRIW